MTQCVQRHLANGEDVESAIILLETEFPAMREKVNGGFVGGLIKQGGK